jgi:hypothetical protein
MATYNITDPDGKTYRITAPDGASEDEVMAYAQRSFKMAKAPESGGIMQGIGNLAAGAVRGAGSIGATLLAPVDAAARAVGVSNDFIGRTDRREQMDAGLKGMGAEPDSWMYKGGKLGGEIAGTAGMGGLLARGASAVPYLAQNAAPLINAIGSSGMTVGQTALTPAKVMALRAAGGAVAGGASAGLVNPNDAVAGATIGAALPPAVKLAGEAGRLTGNAVSGLAKNTLGMTTGAGAETFGTAFRAGKDGGTTFLDNMRGKVPLTDVLDGAKDALSKMRIDRGEQYRSGMVDIANDKSIINFSPIDSAVNSLKTMGSYKGQVINKNAAGTVDEITSLVNQWKNLNPAEYHTPEGLDALKKAIGDIRDAAQFGTPGRKAADTAYNAVKGQIEMQAPTYSKVMKDYSQASETLTEIERALSLGNKAAADTSMRKLQSLMRNNVNTNYGNRLELSKTLEGQGADILPAVAGQAASSMTPRGLQGLAATGAGLAGFMNPATLAALPFTSPRLMGEVSYGLGAMTRGLGGAANTVGKATLPRVNQGLLSQGAYRVAPLLGSEYLFAQ